MLKILPRPKTCNIFFFLLKLPVNLKFNGLKSLIKHLKNYDTISLVHKCFSVLNFWTKNFCRKATVTFGTFKKNLLRPGMEPASPPPPF